LLTGLGDKVILAPTAFKISEAVKYGGRRRELGFLI
jgi:hypothetical protein